MPIQINIIYNHTTPAELKELHLNPDSNEFTNRLGGLMVIIGWILAIGLLGFLYHKMIYTAKEPQVSQVNQITRLTIQQDRDLHFRLQGKINNQNVNFLIDTGASYIALSDALATQLSLHRQTPINVKTASGTARGYLTQIPVIQLGPLIFNDVKAIIMPTMDQKETLLGMSLLKEFNIEQTNNQLILVYPSTN